MVDLTLVTGAAGRVGAVGRTITFQDIPVEPWRDGLLERGLSVHLMNHLEDIKIGLSGALHDLSGGVVLGTRCLVRK